MKKDGRRPAVSGSEGFLLVELLVGVAALAFICSFGFRIYLSGLRLYERMRTEERVWSEAKRMMEEAKEMSVEELLAMGEASAQDCGETAERGLVCLRRTERLGKSGSGCYVLEAELREAPRMIPARHSPSDAEDRDPDGTDSFEGEGDEIPDEDHAATLYYIHVAAYEALPDGGEWKKGEPVCELDTARLE